MGSPKALEKSRAFLCLSLLFIGDIELLKTHVLEAQNTSETKNETNFHTSVTFLMHDCKFNVYSSISSNPDQFLFILSRDMGSIIPTSSIVYSIRPKLQGAQVITKLSRLLLPPRECGIK